MHARSGLAIVVLVLVVATGCLGGSGSLTFSSQPVSVGEDVLSGTGYELEREDTWTIERNFTAGGQTRRAEVTNHVAEYSRSVSVPGVGEGTFARFGVLTTPKVSVLEKTFNPVGDMSNRELAERIQGRYGRIENVQRVEERSVRILGPPTAVTKFEATVTVGGVEVPIYLHVTTLEHESDFVIAVAAHPQALDEESRIDRLLGGIEHGQ